MFNTIKRIAAVSFASVMAFSLVAPTFITEAAAAPLPISTSLAVDHSVQAANLPLTDVRYRRYGRRGGSGAAIGLGILGLGLGIAAIAAQDRAERRRERYQDQYYSGGYYAQPSYYNNSYYNGGYYSQPAPVYSTPYYAAQRPVYYGQPRYYRRRHHNFY